MIVKRCQGALLLTTLAALVLICVSFVERPPRLIWNDTASVPVGLYTLRPLISRVGDIVAVRLPVRSRRLADDRRYLPASALLLKPVAALPGDRVCRWQRRIFINDQFRAEAAYRDAAHRAMPVWQGCRHLKSGEIFVLSPSKDSFDSRYFGPIRRDAIVGIARAIMTF